MTSKRIFVLTVAMLLGQAGFASAQGTSDRWLLHPDLQARRTASLDEPLSLGRSESARPQPVWTAEGLWQTRPAGLRGLSKLAAEATPANDPVWDPSSQAWFAFAYGALVRVEADGRLPVVLANLPGHDFDVRAGHGLVVCRDSAKDRIVLLKTGSAGQERVLLEGGGFYNPRFSPDGSQVLVSQLKNGGGHLWLVSTASGQARDLGEGYEPVWKPDGKQALLLRVTDDGERLTSSSLFLLDPATGAVRLLAAPRRHIVTRPALSPDGAWLAFVDSESQQVMVARLPEAGGAR
ncbi:MAG TPA: hypothetical protein VGK67_28755 [Myxococcales bacterium]|jgi:Tol biopolymer transport system component